MVVTCSLFLRKNVIFIFMKRVITTACMRCWFWLLRRKCNTLKPLRAHHCSKCGICILKMDHHCPYLVSIIISHRWINNCVGARNQKYFILFLIYVHMGEVLATLLGGWQIWNKRFLIKVSILPLYLYSITQNLSISVTFLH